MSAATLNPIRLAGCLPTTPDCLAQQNSVFFFFFGADSLARHLMQLAYDLSAGSVDKTYPLGLVRDVLPLWDQRDKKYHNRDLKPKRWDEIREKLNFTGK
jgi:hypothetical protein